MTCCSVRDCFGSPSRGAFRHRRATTSSCRLRRASRRCPRGHSLPPLIPVRPQSSRRCCLWLVAEAFRPRSGRSGVRGSVACLHPKVIPRGSRYSLSSGCRLRRGLKALRPWRASPAIRVLWSVDSRSGCRCRPCRPLSIGGCRFRRSSPHSGRGLRRASTRRRC